MKKKNYLVLIILIATMSVQVIAQHKDKIVLNMKCIWNSGRLYEIPMIIP